MINLTKRVPYEELNDKQKEIYNYQKVSAVLADYGICTIRLSDDWNGADFIAVDLTGKSINVQLKGRVHFAEKYLNKDLYICFPLNNEWYLYPHDLVFENYNNRNGLTSQPNWEKNRNWHTARPSRDLLDLLRPYLLSDYHGIKSAA
ncbi:MAG: hypothetical protein KDD68_19855 [Bdellovibrionales bacterium]|nr:hypothetical protein [Bdellovibrionales bacterium]